MKNYFFFLLALLNLALFVWGIKFLMPTDYNREVEQAGLLCTAENLNILCHDYRDASRKILDIAMHYEEYYQPIWGSERNYSTSFASKTN